MYLPHKNILRAQAIMFWCSLQAASRCYHYFRAFLKRADSYARVSGAVLLARLNMLWAQARKPQVYVFKPRKIEAAQPPIVLRRFNASNCLFLPLVRS